MKATTFGMRPLECLEHIPRRFRLHHEFCFFLHDRMVALLKEYETAGVHRWVANGIAAVAAEHDFEGDVDVLRV